MHRDQRVIVSFGSQSGRLRLRAHRLGSRSFGRRLRATGAGAPLLLLVACQPAPQATGAVALVDACVRPEDHGSVSDDGQDDRAPLQQALDVAIAGPGCLELGHGVYHATRRPDPGAAAIPSLTIRGPLRLQGQGSTLAMLGSGIRPGESAPADWTLLQVQASDVTITGVAFDGVARASTGEQTHLVQLRGPAERVTIERSSFDLPGERGSGGDCIRLFGEVDRRVRGVVLRDLRAPTCVRSAVGIQRGVHDVLVDRLETAQVHGQAIDGEPTGGPAFGCQPIVSGITIRDSILRRGADRGITVAIAGDGCAVADDVVITDSAIEDGGLDLVDVGQVTLSGLRIESARSPEDAAPALYAHRRVGSLIVRDTRIVRLAGSKLQPVVQVSAGGQPDQRPVAAIFHRVVIEQPDPRAAIRVEGVRSLLVRDSQLVYRGAQLADWAVSGTVESMTLADVTLAGPWRGVASPSAGQPVLVRVEARP